ncbi:U-box domain-containing protein [Xylariaceae sp. FL1651]|nr:U-box domain-containing protein [Xylariaceae sp. FL1651]
MKNKNFSSYNSAMEEQYTADTVNVAFNDRYLDSESRISVGTLVTDDPVVTIHPLTTKDGVLVKVQSPVHPLDPNMDHVACDIVLVIDVSGSMNSDAPAAVTDEQGNAAKEHLGLSVLDLTKHAARTILSALNKNDRLGIVTFSSDAEVVQMLAPMTEAQKLEVNTKIDRMRTDSATNLWAGIIKGLGLFDPRYADGRVPALMILTDGQPNYMGPPQGYVPKIRSMSLLPATIHTFGFGYGIKSGLLKSIAEAGNGNYAFIPDAGMIGTVFIHAVAHLQSTYATKCTLEVSAPEGVLLKRTAGKSIDQKPEDEFGNRTLGINLGNLQYGQSRDIYLENISKEGKKVLFDPSGKDTVLHAKLTYSRMRTPQYVTFADQNLLESSPLPQSIIAYHQSRSMICDLLSSFFSLKKDLEYGSRPVYRPDQFQQALQNTLDHIPAKNYKDQYNKSLMEDLNGQISEALSRRDYFDRWGSHYFLGLWDAHSKQLCNSFKDSGPLMYNNNPFFIRCRDNLDKAFDNIPPPTPSKPQAVSFPIRLSMSKYNQSNGPCFAASSPVMLATGREVPVCTLRQNMTVQTPLGPRRVRAVLKTRVRRMLMCRVGELVATPWHPVKVDGVKLLERMEDKWVFPAKVAEQMLLYSGFVYSVLLQPDRDTDAHAVRIGGVWGVTLGHGLLSGDDVRAHQFLGDYTAVSKKLMMLGVDRYGVFCSAGVKRDAGDGMVCGFKRLRGAYVNGVRNTGPVKGFAKHPRVCII